MSIRKKRIARWPKTASVKTRTSRSPSVPAFILDLDGTLVDSVYQHVFAWHTALRECGYDLNMWRIHRKIGMSGALLLRALSEELGSELDDEARKRVEQKHSEEFAKLRPAIRPFPEVRE